MNLKSKLLSIINKINGETGEQDTNVTDAVRTLIESGGGGGSKGNSAIVTVNTFKPKVINNNFVANVTARTNKYSAIDVQSSTSLSQGVFCTKGDLVIACIVLRDELSFITDGWEIISKSDAFDGPQYVLWAYKYAESNEESITVNCVSSNRIYINMVAIGNGKSKATFVDNGYKYVTSGNSITVQKPSGITLWCASSYNWVGSTNWGVSSDSLLVEIPPANQPRLLLALDRTNDSEVTFTNSAGDYKFLVGSLTINNITNFDMGVSI